MAEDRRSGPTWKQIGGPASWIWPARRGVHATDPQNGNILRYTFAEPPDPRRIRRRPASALAVTQGWPPAAAGAVADDIPPDADLRAVVARLRAGGCDYEEACVTAEWRAL